VHARHERRQNLAKSPIALSLKRTEVQQQQQLQLLLLRACRLQLWACRLQLPSGF
jgi:hypothetical protein